MASFADQIRAFDKKTEAKMEKAARKIAVDAFSAVIAESPVDTGRLRSNWQVAIGSAPSGVIGGDSFDDTPKESFSKQKGDDQAVAAGNLKLGDTAFLANNLPYARRLMNDGWSVQAPTGSFDLVVQRFQAIADKVIAEVGRE